MLAQLLVQVAEHELVGRVVADAEHKVERPRAAALAEVDEALRHHALVDVLQASLDVPLAGPDNDREGGEDMLQRELHLLGLHHPKLGVRVRKVPRHRRALREDVRAVRHRAVALHDRRGDGAPGGVDPVHKLLPLPALHAVREAVLDGEREVGDGPKRGEHLLLPEPGEDHDVVLRVGAERLQRVEHALRHDVAVGGVARVVQAGVGWRECAAPVEEQRAVRGALELVQRLDDVERLEAGAHPDHAEAREAEADRDEVLLALCLRGLEVRHEAVRELLERAALDVRQVLEATR
mmetsp:Transcript_33463/g.99565  ORF Transcript_33463/g.99565 Transcript_33463/m.99565 type:complete len:294 (+) Transcript_33463:413-1294(+)